MRGMPFKKYLKFDSPKDCLSFKREDGTRVIREKDTGNLHIVLETELLELYALGPDGMARRVDPNAFSRIEKLSAALFAKKRNSNWFSRDQIEAFQAIFPDRKGRPARAYFKSAGRNGTHPPMQALPLRWKSQVELEPKPKPGVIAFVKVRKEIAKKGERSKLFIVIGESRSRKIVELIFPDGRKRKRSASGFSHKLFISPENCKLQNRKFTSKQLKAWIKLQPESVQSVNRTTGEIIYSNSPRKARARKRRSASMWRGKHTTYVQGQS